jgi:hypothetical protein
MEALQNVLGWIRDIMNRCVVSTQDEFHSLETHLAIRLRPTPVIADHHAHEPAEGSPHSETFGTGFKVIALGVLEGATGFIVLMSGNVHLVVSGNN